jgi:hypothetical protein
MMAMIQIRKQASSNPGGEVEPLAQTKSEAAIAASLQFVC